MKKIFALVLALSSLCAVAQAADIGIGYNGGSPAFKVWWNDSFASELGVSWNYSKTDSPPLLPRTQSSLTMTLAPLMWSFFRNEYGSLSTGIKFKNYINFYQGTSGSILTANDYSVLLALPEMEINIPWVDGLRITGMMSAAFTWAYDDRSGSFTGYTISFSGFSLASLGLMYYFSAGAPEKPAAAADITAPSGDGVTKTAK